MKRIMRIMAVFFALLLACAACALAQGDLYEQGCNAYDAGDYEQALVCWLEAAEQGDAGAAKNIGWLYRNGYGVEQDYEESLQWYIKSAEMGDTDAAFCVAEEYCAGQHVPRDYEKALQWYKVAAQRGDAEAMRNIGSFYYYGYGTQKDDMMALEWYMKAAECNFAPVMSDIAFMYRKGAGVEQDLALALQWDMKGVELGDRLSMYNVGVLYMNGEGVKQDDGKAMEYFEKAAELGHAEFSIDQCIVANHIEQVGNQIIRHRQPRLSNTAQACRNRKGHGQGQHAHCNDLQVSFRIFKCIRTCAHECDDLSCQRIDHAGCHSADDGIEHQRIARNLTGAAPFSRADCPGHAGCRTDIERNENASHKIGRIVCQSHSRNRNGGDFAPAQHDGIDHREQL